MKSLIFPLLLTSFFICGSQLHANCKVPPGPQGPPPSNYIGSFRDTPQFILVPSVAANVVFPGNFAGPVGIIKSPNNDAFTVQNAGVYLISWTVNIESPRQILPPNNVALILKVNGIPVLPNPISQAFLVGSTNSNIATYVDLSGQKLLNLPAGAVITLEVVGSFTIDTESLQIISAMFNIAEVANSL